MDGSAARSYAMIHRVETVGVKAVSLLTACLVALGLVGWSALAGQDGPVDFEKARQLRQRVLKGEKLGEEERAYLERAKAAFQKKQAGAMRVAAAGGKGSLGLTPLTDLAGEARYKGQDGGLYGEGENGPPEALLRAALEASRKVRPLDAQGQPAPDGKVVLISVGMSNTTQEFRALMTLAGNDADRSPSMMLVDGAQGGMEASAWADPEQGTRAGRPDPWSVLDGRLKQSGVTARQVQVAWVKQARANPAALGEFPRHAEVLREDLAVIARKLRDRFPNLKLVYVSSRIYAGYASTSLNPEPYAYESAFAVRRLIRDQIGGDPGLNPDPTKGEVKAPLLLWGPYLWADGVKGRKGDGLVWTRGDLAGDGTHPGDDGQRKVAELLLKFLKTDPTAKDWFLKGTAPVPARSGVRDGTIKPPVASPITAAGQASGEGDHNNCRE
jgi:hypothetical protein